MRQCPPIWMMPNPAIFFRTDLRRIRQVLLYLYAYACTKYIQQISYEESQRRMQLPTRIIIFHQKDMIVNQLIVILIYMLVGSGDGKRAYGVRPINCANYHMLLMTMLLVLKIGLKLREIKELFVLFGVVLIYHLFQCHMNYMLPS